MQTIRSLTILAAAALLTQAASAGTLAVNTTNDSHSVGFASQASPSSSSAADPNGKISLRSALEYASTRLGPWTITLPTGTYQLNLGDLVAGAGPNTSIAVQGQGAPADTLIVQTQSGRRLFVVNYNLQPNVVFSLANVTLAGGNVNNTDPDGFGGDGGALLAGGSSDATGNVVALTNVVFSGNIAGGTGVDDASGGAICMTGGGDLALAACSFANCQAGAGGGGAGGAIFFDADFNPGNLSIYNSTFVNNAAHGASNAGQGGAIYLAGGAGNGFSISQCSFTGNSAGSEGGAIYLSTGNLTASFNRITDNTAPVGSGLYMSVDVAPARWADLRNNWWGGNEGPNGAGGDSVWPANSASPPLGNSQVAYNPWIVLAGPLNYGPITADGAVLMEAGFLQNSSGQALAPSQVAALVGVPVTWNGAAHGYFVKQQTAVQADGQAQAVFINDGSCANGSGSVVVDHAAITAEVTVLCVDLIVSQSDNAGGVAALGGSWIWAIHVANSGVGAASIADGTVILVDNLPNANISYAPPTLANASGIVGTVTADIDANGNLSCAANGPVVINSGGSFDVRVAATPLGVGTYANPRLNGLCQVDPNNSVAEVDETNNVASPDSVQVLSQAIWTNPRGGSWPVATNWMDGLAGSGSGFTADFSTLTLPSDALVTLDSAPTIGNLIFADAGKSHNWTLANGTGGPLTLDAGLIMPVIQVVNETATITATLTGTNGCVAAGSGALVLAGINTYLGTTVVTGGKLLVMGSIVGAVTVQSGAALGGSGSIGGSVTINGGGALAPGAPGALGVLTVSGPLILAGNASFRLSKAHGTLTSDRVAGLPAVAYGGALIVTAAGDSLANGDAFSLFSAASQSGAFSTLNLPTLASGLAWIWDGSSGTLSVVSIVNPQPTTLAAVVSAGNLNLSWPPDHTGWRLLVQTNRLNVGLSANWFTWPNSTNLDSVSIPIDRANGAVFYRLVYP